MARGRWLRRCLTAHNRLIRGLDGSAGGPALVTGVNGNRVGHAVGVADAVDDRLHRPAEPVFGVGHPRLAFVHA